MQQNSALQGYATGSMRQLNWRLSMSFDKTYLSSVTFFKVGDSGSTIGGPDIIPGTNLVVQEWDKYQYADYSDRVISIELTREVEQVNSVTMCYGDIVLNNYDDYFTPGAGSPIDAYLLPYRPLRIYEGFGDQLVPVFVGLTSGTPVIDERAKTASFHIIDFLFSVADAPLDTIALSTSVRTDQAISSVLVAAGLLAGQLSLDRGYNTLNYFAVSKGTKVIDVLRRLMEAEQGRLYMDEQGVIQFKNRQNYLSSPVMTFDAYNNIISASRTREDSIVNVVEIKSDLRTLQVNQKVFELQTATLINGGSTVDIWADFSDPVSTVDTPVEISGATTSSFTVNPASDGSGTNDTSSVTLTTGTQYGTSYKMTFTSTASTDLYITNVQIYGTPYKVTDSLYVRETDATSVSKYAERIVAIQNDFFQDQSSAVSKAKILLDQYSQFAAVQELEVKGTPALQLDDPIRVDIFGRIQNAKITRIQTRLANNQFAQTIRCKVFNPRSYFAVGDSGSQIGGTDYISF